MAANAIGDDENPFDFRNARWGMSMEEIMDNEDGSLQYEGDHRLLFRDEIMDKKFMIEYVFGQGQLYKAVFWLVEDYVMENNYIHDYFAFKKVITGKYGAPVKERVIWNKSHLRDDQSQWGVAVSVGDLAYFTAWENENTAISAILRGKDFTVDCTLEYISKALAHLGTQTGKNAKSKDKTKKRQRKLTKEEKAF
jgi:hypothetical protein